MENTIVKVTLVVMKQLKQLQDQKKDLTAFKPMASVIPVRCSTLIYEALLGVMATFMYLLR